MLAMALPRTPPKKVWIVTALAIAIAAAGCSTTPHGSEPSREATTTTSLPVSSEVTVPAGTHCVPGVPENQQVECLVQPGRSPNPPCYTATENCDGLPSDVPVVNGYPSPAMDGYFDRETTTSTSPAVFVPPSTTTTQCFKTPAQSGDFLGLWALLQAANRASAPDPTLASTHSSSIGHLCILTDHAPAGGVHVGPHSPRGSTPHRGMDRTSQTYPVHIS